MNEKHHCRPRSRKARRIGYKLPFPAHFLERSTYEKDRQRYALHLTVFWLRLVCISKKTDKKTVNLSD
jgi:hypothetical protein